VIKVRVSRSTAITDLIVTRTVSATAELLVLFLTHKKQNQAIRIWTTIFGISLSGTLCHSALLWQHTNTRIQTDFALISIAIQRNGRTKERATRESSDVSGPYRTVRRTLA